MHFTFRLGALLCALFLASLTGCHDNLDGSSDSIFVTPSSPTVAAVIGGSQTVPVSFYSSDGYRQSLVSVAGTVAS
jgi:hypothetical protein